MIKTLTILIILLGGGGFLGYQKFYKPEYGKDFKKDIESVTLQEDILKFTYKKLNNVYALIINYDNEILLINKEVERLVEMEKEFPKQIKIILDEKKIWEEARTNLVESLAALENEIVSIYVTHKVNQQKGITLIKEKKESLHATANDTIVSYKELTKRLKPTMKKEPKSK